MRQIVKKEQLDKVKSTSKKIDLDSRAPLRRALFRVQRAKFLMQRGFATPLRPSWGGGRPYNQ